MYMRLKQRYGADILIDVEIHHVNSAQLMATIETLNRRNDVQAIIVQLPLLNPSQTEDILSSVSPDKDVDGLNPRVTNFLPATPTAINWLLAGYNIELGGRKIAIVGRGRLVGAPLEAMWRNSRYNVTVFERSDDLCELIRYDVIVTATGSPRLIQPAMLKRGAIVVDAGTASEDGKLLGDTAPAVRERDDIIITPEKGGVGPLTVTTLFDNVITACLRHINV